MLPSARSWDSATLETLESASACPTAVVLEWTSLALTAVFIQRLVVFYIVCNSLAHVWLASSTELLHVHADQIGKEAEALLVRDALGGVHQLVAQVEVPWRGAFFARAIFEHALLRSSLRTSCSRCHRKRACTSITTWRCSRCSCACICSAACSWFDAKC